MSLTNFRFCFQARGDRWSSWAILFKMERKREFETTFSELSCWVLSKQIVKHKQAFLLLLRDDRWSLGAIPSKRRKARIWDHVLLVNQLGASQMNS